jgi:hypothetical protein
MGLPRAQDQNDRKWAEKAQELEFTASDRVKASAEKWVTSIASLTGVFGIITLIKAPEDISTLTFGWKVGVGVALLIAVTCASLSIYFGALAAQGIPRSNWLSAAAVRRGSIAAAEQASKRLHTSRVLVVPAVILLATAVAFTWFGDREIASNTPTTVLAVQKSGVVICGTLTADVQGHPALKVKDQSITILNEVVSLAVIGNCP